MSLELGTPQGWAADCGPFFLPWHVFATCLLFPSASEQFLGTETRTAHSHPFSPHPPEPGTAQGKPQRCFSKCPGKESSRMAFWQPVTSPGEIPGQAGDAGAWRGELRGEQEQRGSTRAADSPGMGSWSTEGKKHLGIKISLVCTEEADLTHL